MPELINPPKDLDMQTFRSLMSIYGGLAKTSRFVARINSSPLPMRDSDKDSSKIRKDLAYLCEAAELPGRGFVSTDIHYYGPNFKVPFQSSYEDLNLTFICRDSFLERQFFDDWLDVINPISTYDFSYTSSNELSTYDFTYTSANELSTYDFTYTSANELSTYDFTYTSSNELSTYDFTYTLANEL